MEKITLRHMESLHQIAMEELEDVNRLLLKLIDVNELAWAVKREIEIILKNNPVEYADEDGNVTGVENLIDEVLAKIWEARYDENVVPTIFYVQMERYFPFNVIQELEEEATHLARYQLQENE